MDLEESNLQGPLLFCLLSVSDENWNFGGVYGRIGKNQENFSFSSLYSFDINDSTFLKME